MLTGTPWTGIFPSVGGRDAKERKADVGAPRPTNPANPSTSPARSSNEMSWNAPSRRRPLTVSRTVSRVAAVAPKKLLHFAADHAPDRGGGG